MDFSNRTQKANKLIELLNEHYWCTQGIQDTNRIFHESYGYETHVSDLVKTELRHIYTTTVKHIRFTPDCIVGQTNSRAPEPVLLLEYKVTTTPRYTLKDDQWNSGQIEADAWDNYTNLMKIRVQIAVIIFCPYHPRPLLCDFPDSGWLTNPRTQVMQSTSGSRTDYCNIDLRKLRTFTEFMSAHFAVPKATSDPLVKNFLDIAQKETLLQTTHDYKSIYKDHKTGFNWI